MSFSAGTRIRTSHLTRAAPLAFTTIKGLIIFKWFLLNWFSVRSQHGWWCQEQLHLPFLGWEPSVLLLDDDTISSAYADWPLFLFATNEPGLTSVIYPRCWMAANLRVRASRCALVTPVGFEPNIADLRGRPPKPLEDGAISVVKFLTQPYIYIIS